MTEKHEEYLIVDDHSGDDGKVIILVPDDIEGDWHENPGLTVRRVTREQFDKIVEILSQPKATGRRERPRRQG